MVMEMREHGPCSGKGLSKMQLQLDGLGSSGNRAYTVLAKALKNLGPWQQLVEDKPTNK